MWSWSGQFWKLKIRSKLIFMISSCKKSRPLRRRRLHEVKRDHKTSAHIRCAVFASTHVCYYLIMHTDYFSCMWQSRARIDVLCSTTGIKTFLYHSHQTCIKMTFRMLENWKRISFRNSSRLPLGCSLYNINL